MGPSTRTENRYLARNLNVERLFVPLDGSARAEQALPVAAMLSRRHESSLVLCTVLEPPPKSPAASTAEASNELARRYLAEMVGAARDQGIRATGIVRTGPVPEGLLAVALEERASLIVMSTPDRQAPESIGGAAAAGGLLRTSPIPILAVPPAGLAAPPANPLGAAARAMRTMLIAAEGAGPDGLIEGSLRFAEACGVELAVLLQVVPPGRSGREEAELRVDAEEQLGQWARPFQESQIPTLLVVTNGNPVESILSTAKAESADVIAISGRAESPEAPAPAKIDVEELIGRSSVPVLSLIRR